MYKNIENMLIIILKTSCEIWLRFCDNYSMSKKNSQPNILALSRIKTTKFLIYKFIYFFKKKGVKEKQEIF